MTTLIEEPDAIMARLELSISVAICKTIEKSVRCNEACAGAVKFSNKERALTRGQADAEYLFIVARDQLDLYAYLMRTFSGDRRIRVVLDERAEERPQLPDGPEAERREIERRTESKAAQNLRSFGFAVLRLIY